MVGEPGYGGAQSPGKQAQRLNMRCAHAGHTAGGRTEASNRKAKVVQIGHGSNLTSFHGERAGSQVSTKAVRPQRGSVLGPGIRSGVGVVMVVMAMVVMRGREHRAGKHQQKQGSCENLFHAKTVARPCQAR
jgi:hypothetical protein